MNTSDSLSENDCLICYDKLAPTSPYSFPDGEINYKKCHPECLERWYNVSNRGLVTDTEIKSYTIYHEGNVIETIPVLNIPDTEINMNIVDNDIITDEYNTCCCPDVCVPLMTFISLSISIAVLVYLTT